MGKQGLGPWALRSWGLMLAGVACAGCGCNLPTCGSLEEGTITLPLTPPDLTDVSVEACRNDDCRTGTFEELQGLEPGGFETTLALSPPADVQEAPALRDVTVHIRVLEAELDFRFQWTVPTSDARSGNVLSVTLTRENGEVLYTGSAKTPAPTEYEADNCDHTRCRSSTTRLPN